VLIVDDEPLVLWSLGEALQAAGFTVSEAGDARSAVGALIRGAEPQAVLLDLRLPDSDDLRLLQAIRRLAPAAAVILMTAFATPAIRQEAMRLGAAGFLEKPFELADAVHAVERTLGESPGS
jgi:DNA-binding NtrC family response regulator